jgi:hypothetical protein
VTATSQPLKTSVPPMKGTSMRHRWSDDMDGTRFDALTKRLTGMPSRRQVVKGLGGGLTVALGAILATSPAAAGCRDDGSDCKKGGQCCSGICFLPDGAPANQKGACCTPACPDQMCGDDGCGSSCECLAPATCGGGGTPGMCGTSGGGGCTPNGTACDPNAFEVTCCSKICQRDGYEGKACPGSAPYCCL